MTRTTMSSTPRSAISHGLRFALPDRLDQSFRPGSKPFRSKRSLERARRREVPAKSMELTAQPSKRSMRTLPHPRGRTQGLGRTRQSACSASQPRINLTRSHPAEATVAGNFRLTAENASSDIRHIILDFGKTAFRPRGPKHRHYRPGNDANGRPHKPGSSIASPRDGERPNTNNLS
jgi:hypothetical protein